VRVARRGPVIDILLDAPQTGNLITEDISAVLVDVLAGVDLDQDVKLVRLAASGDDFCRGRKSPAIDRSTATAMAFRQTIAAGPLRLYAAMRECAAPVLGLVQGQALGVGCALAALCDLTIATHDAVFGIPELDHGIPPTLVMAALADRVPYKTITHMVLARQRLSGEAAVTAGIVGQLVPADQLQESGAAVEAALAACSPMAVRAVKEYARSARALEPAARDSLASTLISVVQSSQNR
jgi:enoyl-CoA hydratase/carnithine racemase